MKLHHLFENEIPEITSPMQAFAYAVAQGKRVPELESLIMQSPYFAYCYARNVIKGRWLEAESIIFTNLTAANGYLLAFPDARTPSKDVPLVLGNYAIMDVPNTITDEQVLKLIKLIHPMNTREVLYHRKFFEPQIKRQLDNNLLKQTTTQALINNNALRKKFFKEIDGYDEQRSDFE